MDILKSNLINEDDIECTVDLINPKAFHLMTFSGHGGVGGLAARAFLSPE